MAVGVNVACDKIMWVFKDPEVGHDPGKINKEMKV